MTLPPYGRSVPGNDWTTLDGHVRQPPPSVSVIIAHFEQPDQLQRVLLALERQTHPRDRLEIIVVDDGSTTAPAVPDGVRLVRQADEGFRLAAARNRGVEAASGDVLVFLDADTVPEPDYVSLMARLPSVAPESVVVGRRLHADLAGVPLDARIEEVAPARRLPDPAWLREEYKRSANLLHADDRSYRFMIGAVLACSRWFALEVGGFDESFTTYGGEDWEWAWRCWLDGAIFAHEADAVAWHDGPDWSGRDTDRSAKARETQRLAQAIPTRGSRPLGLLLDTSDTLVVVEGAMSAVELLITVDSVLRAAPFAHVRVPHDDAGSFDHDPRVSVGFDDSTDARYRVRVLIVAACVVTSTDGTSAFAHLTELVGNGELGSVTVADDTGTLLVVRSRRAFTRNLRWPESTFVDRTESAASIALRLRPQASLAAHYGGWL